MRGRVLLALAGLVLLGVIAGGFGVLGYYSHKLQLSPIYELAERAERVTRRAADLPDETVAMVDRIETIFATLEGQVFTMPDRDHQGGGALTVWGDDLIAMHKSGKLFALDAATMSGLDLLPIALPDNGAAGYAALAEEKYPGRPTRLDAVRYNDIEYVETRAHRGLALSYTFIDVQNECYRSRVSWLPLDDGPTGVRDIEVAADDWTLLWQSEPCLAFNPDRELIVAYMAGGRLTPRGPDKLVIGQGEYHLDGIYRPDAGIQDDATDYGKVIEIDIATGDSRHLSKGHRNLQGMALDAEGRIWTTEHGMRGGDELNLIVEGENYGWPEVDMGTLYNGVPAPNPDGPGRHDSYRAPVYAWVPSAAVSSLALVDGDFVEAWDGDLLVGSLKGRTLFRARIMDERLVSLEPIEIGQRVRDVTQWGPDRLALWLDTNQVVVFEVVERADPFEGLARGLADEGLSEAEVETTVATLQGCAECHSFEGGIHGAGPSLYRVTERTAGVSGFAHYTPALATAGGSWDEDRLAAFLRDPESVVPGTAMAGLGVGDPGLAGNLAIALGWLSEHAAAGE